MSFAIIALVAATAVGSANVDLWGTQPELESSVDLLPVTAPLAAAPPHHGADWERFLAWIENNIYKDKRANISEEYSHK